MRQQEYVRMVVDTYVSLPGAPLRPRRDDRFLATKLYRQGIRLDELEAAMLLGCARRELQEYDQPLQPIRSLRYFVPVLDEVRQQPLPDGYVDYLRAKLSERLRPRPMKNKRPRACVMDIPWGVFALRAPVQGPMKHHMRWQQRVLP